MARLDHQCGRMRKTATLGFILGFLPGLGVFIGAASAYWIQGPTSPLHPDYSNSANYDVGICPPGYEPQFFGVTIVDSQSRPIYLCLKPGLGGSSQVVEWDEVQEHDSRATNQTG